ncbi:Uu.00g088710.m01.CDS01 [Anthostomella pinea]|uniref:Uu.00g088710.m01.CDS01 n=1 Tax=Anthostomella pinea TaxID=933095 RepID=A0AAI8VMK6_9PEZI|nr:Uu.00g088710.m01.CDS01 [Anthostomella pinea]
MHIHATLAGALGLPLLAAAAPAPTFPNTTVFWKANQYTTEHCEGAPYATHETSDTIIAVIDAGIAHSIDTSTPDADLWVWQAYNGGLTADLQDCAGTYLADVPTGCVNLDNLGNCITCLAPVFRGHP